MKVSKALKDAERQTYLGDDGMTAISPDKVSYNAWGSLV